MPTSTTPREPRDRAGKTVPKKAYAGVLDAVFSSVLEENRRVEGERAEAAHLAAELDRLSSSQRRLVVSNSARYQTWGLAEFLLARCRRTWSHDPTAAEETAHLALRVMEGLEVAGFRAAILADMRSEVWGYIANCRRIRFDLAAAATAFRQAEEALAQGTGDAAERARLMDLKASYYTVAGEFARARAALDDVIRSYRRAGDIHLEGRAFLSLAKVHYDAGEVEAAVGALESARARIDVERDPYLEFLLEWTRLAYLTELDRVEEASRLLPAVRELARSRAPRLERLRFLWTEGVLRKKAGQLELAEATLKQVREGYLAAKIPIDVALVSLDLAEVYLRLGRTQDVQRMALEALPLFASQGIRREVLMAWSLFLGAAEREATSARLLRWVGETIREAQKPRRA